MLTCNSIRKKNPTVALQFYTPNGNSFEEEGEGWGTRKIMKNVCFYTSSTKRKKNEEMWSYKHNCLWAVFRNQPKFGKNLSSHHMMVHRLLSSAGCAAACWYLCDSDGLYVNSEVSSPYWFIYSKKKERKYSSSISYARDGHCEK